MLQACHLATQKAKAIKHTPLGQQFKRLKVYRVPNLLSAWLLVSMLLFHMLLTPFATAHLQRLHPNDGHDIQQLIPYTLKQYTSPITKHTKLYWYVLSLHKVAFGLYALWQESWLHACIFMHEPNGCFVWNSLVWFSTNPSPQKISAKPILPMENCLLHFFPVQVWLQ